MTGIFIALAVLGSYVWSQPEAFFSFNASDIVMPATITGTIPVVLPMARNVPLSLDVPAPLIKASASAAYDEDSDFRLISDNPDGVRSIASITKLMTALVFLDHNPGWDTSYTISRNDYREGGKIHVYPGDTASVRDIFRTALIASDNVAIAALVSATGMSEADFVAAMNAKARLLNLKHSGFFDPTGLDARNISTAHDIARLANEAFSKPDIIDALTRSEFSFTTKEGSAKHVVTTDQLLKSDVPGGVTIVAGKTGYLPKAGYCFVGQFEKNGKKITTVVLGADTEEGRFNETKKLVDWAFKNYRWE